MIRPYLERPLAGGTQKLYKFENGYGASVVRHIFSYGHEEGLWELSVVEFDYKDGINIIYDTPVTDDVIGNLDERDIEPILLRIKNLKPRPTRKVDLD